MNVRRRRKRWESADESSAGDPCPELLRSAVCARACRANRQCRRPARPQSKTLAGSIALLRHHLDVPAAGAFQQLAGFSFGVFRIARFDHDEIAVVRSERESSVLQKRMMQAW